MMCGGDQRFFSLYVLRDGDGDFGLANFNLGRDTSQIRLLLLRKVIESRGFCLVLAQLAF